MAERKARPLYRNNFADIKENRGIKDATRALQVHFTAARLPQSLPNDGRRLLQNFVEEHDGSLTDEEADDATHELTSFYQRYVGDIPQKLGIFVGVLRELRPAIVGEANIMNWWQSVVKPVVSNVGYSRPALKDAQEFLVGVMVQETDGEAEPGHARMVTKLCNELLGIYISRTRNFTENDHYSARENQQIALQVENVLCAFGQKQPNDLFHGLSDLVHTAGTRMQALTLLNSFLRHQSPRLYQVVQTPVVEQLLKCLMNDTSTTILSVALTSLLMLLPHIPGSLGPHLPRLFLIYSRLLCWERFNPQSTLAERNLVTDDRLAHDSRDPGDVGIDSSWEKVRPEEGIVEPSAPEITTYFTHLYGLYPLHLMTYIRKPRKFLKNVDFPGADDFDLDQAVIRNRSDQFRQEHLCHPNFYLVTIEEELVDSKWAKMEAAEVVAECHALCLVGRPSLTPPGPPPTGKLPEPPAMPPMHSSRSRAASPVQSHASFRSGNSWRNTQSTAVQSPISGDADSPKESGTESGDNSGTEIGRRPSIGRVAALQSSGPSLDDFPRPGSAKTLGGNSKDEVPITNLAYLQRELALLRNQLNFERWHKTQYSAHISSLSRNTATKNSVSSAEHLNLINTNRSLKRQLENLKASRLQSGKDGALSRNNSKNLEAHLSEKLSKLKRDQETFMTERAELQRLREQSKEYRELLVQSEAREMEHTHNLDIMQRDAEQLHKMKTVLAEAQRRIRDYEYAEFDFEQARQEIEILAAEKETLQKRLQSREQERERSRRAYMDKIADLEAQVEALEPLDFQGARPGTQQSQHVREAVREAVAEAQLKLAQLKKAHARLLERHTDLELEFQSVKAQLEDFQAGGHGGQTQRQTRQSDYVSDDSNSNPHYLFSPKSQQQHQQQQQRPDLSRQTSSDDYGLPNLHPTDSADSDTFPRGHFPPTGNAYLNEHFADFLPPQRGDSRGPAATAYSSSDPTGRRFQPPPHPHSQATTAIYSPQPPNQHPPSQQSGPGIQRSESTATSPYQMSGGLPLSAGFRSPPPPQSAYNQRLPPATRNGSMASGASSTSGIRSTFNRTAPLSEAGGSGEGVKSSGMSAFSDGSDFGGEGGGSGVVGKKKGDKIGAKSEVRVYGRGGAQNIKLKNKDKDKDKEGGKKGSSSGKETTQPGADDSSSKTGVAGGGEEKKKGFRRFISRTNLRPGNPRPRRKPQTTSLFDALADYGLSDYDSDSGHNDGRSVSRSTVRSQTSYSVLAPTFLTPRPTIVVTHPGDEMHPGRRVVFSDAEEFGGRGEVGRHPGREPDGGESGVVHLEVRMGEGDQLGWVEGKGNGKGEEGKGMGPGKDSGRVLGLGERRGAKVAFAEKLGKIA